MSCGTARGSVSLSKSQKTVDTEQPVVLAIKRRDATSLRLVDILYCLLIKTYAQALLHLFSRNSNYFV